MAVTTVEQDARAGWLARRAEVAADEGAGWEERYKPGSFGCHELLDRVNTVGNLVETLVAEHPACVLKEEWHALAERAAEALRELYQQVGAEHV